MQEIIKQLLGEKSGQWIGLLTSKFGFDAGQAKSFVPAILDKVMAVVGGGKLDLTKGLDPTALLSKLDVDDLAKQSGVDTDKARQGLEGILPDVAASIQEKAGGASGLLSMLGGKGGGVLGKVAKLFGK